LTIEDGAAFSATRLERWADCPFKYFLENILNIAVLDPPEELLEIDPMERGSLLHRVLERFLNECSSAGIVPAYGAPWQKKHLALLTGIAVDEFERPAGAASPAIHCSGRQLRARCCMNLAVFLQEDDALRAANLSRPVYAEYSFGLSGDTRSPRHPAFGFLTDSPSAFAAR
jgi:ATP-dependent helicase/nuclease subunit B